MTQTNKQQKLSTDFLYNVGIRGGGDIVCQGIKFVSLFIVIKSMSSSELGVWAQVQLVLLLVPSIVILRLEAALVRFLSKETKEMLLEKVSASIGLALIFSITIFLAFFFFQKQLSVLIFASSAYNEYVILLGAWIVVRSLQELVKAVLRSRENVFVLVLMQFLSAVFFFGSAILVFFYKNSISALIILLIVGELIILVGSLIYIWSLDLWCIKKLLSFKSLKSYVKFSAPLTLNHLVVWITDNADKLLLLYFLGVEYVGIYYVLTTVAQIVSRVLTPLQFVLFPRLALLWNTSKPDKVSVYSRFCMGFIFIIGVPITFGLTILLPTFSLYFFDDVELSSIMLGIMASAFLVDQVRMVFRHIILLLNKTLNLLKTNIVLLFLSVIVNFALVSNLQLYGAATARLTISLITAVLFYQLIRKEHPFKIDWMLIVKSFAASWFMYFVVSSFVRFDYFDFILIPLLGILLYGALIAIPRFIPHYIKSFIFKGI